MTNAPEIACTLSESARRERAAALRAGLLRRIRSTRELDDGVALAFPLEAESEVRELAAFESSCCGFARWAVERDDASGRVVLEIRGPEGTAAFLRESLGVLPAQPRETDARGAEPAGAERRWLRCGAGGAVAALSALVLCETATLAALLGALGLAAGATAAVTRWTDFVAVPLLLGSLALVAWALRRRRRITRRVA